MSTDRDHDTTRPWTGRSDYQERSGIDRAWGAEEPEPPRDLTRPEWKVLEDYRMARALDHAERRGNHHRRILRTAETNGERRAREENFEIWGDWIDDRAAMVREHFMATYLDLGGGTSHGRRSSTPPTRLEPNGETDRKHHESLERSFRTATSLARTERQENNARAWGNLRELGWSSNEERPQWLR